MREAGHGANVVVYTTMIKGCCQAGDVSAAAELVDAMAAEEPPVRPDVRCWNTFIRGCARVGDGPRARRAFEEMQRDCADLRPDAVTYRCVGQVLSQALRLKQARGLLRDLRCREAAGDAEAAAALTQYGAGAALEFDVAVAAALLGRRAPAAAALRRARRRAGGEGGGLFASMRRDDVLRECDRVAAFVGSEKDSDVAAHLGRTFPFSARIETEVPAAGHPAAAELPGLLTTALRRGFGAAALFRRGVAEEAALLHRFARCFNARGRLRWDRVFAPAAGGAKRRRGGDAPAPLPVKLEICSGGGDWIAAQARTERGRAAWAALELRHERVHRIFTHMAFGGLGNLAVLGGDAAQILPRHIRKASVEHVCVNFPEPPHHSGAEGAESRLHLLTPEFFRAMHRVVRTGGGVTIHSDSAAYTRSLARTAAALRGADERLLFESRCDVAGCPRYDDVEGVRVYHGVPGPDCGHAVHVASYFDRFWEHGKQRERYYIALVATAAAAVQPGIP